MADLDPPAVALPETIGRYRVLRLLGEGSMGRVLLAHDPVLDRDVAVKHLRADLSIPDEVRRGLVTRMRHEARAAARVMHPHLVTLHDMGEDDRFGLYLVFEYVEGPTLKEQVTRGALAPAAAAKVASDLGAALTTAHEAGILHRDIKPENVILSKKGAKIADFGIARIPDSTLTHQGGLMGTPAYSAPETFRTSTFSPASDQFSLAASLYEAVSGKRAFPGDDAVAVAQRILHESAEPCAAAAGVPLAVDEVFARALSRKPRERYPSCEAFGRALAEALVLKPGAPDGVGGGAGEIAAGAAGAALQAAEGGAVTSETHLVSARDLKPERKGSHVILGVVAVLVTGALLLRTALRADDPAGAPARSGEPAAAAAPLVVTAAKPRASVKSAVRATAAPLPAAMPSPSLEPVAAGSGGGGDVSEPATATTSGSADMTGSGSGSGEPGTTTTSSAAAATASASAVEPAAGPAGSVEAAPHPRKTPR